MFLVFVMTSIIITSDSMRTRMDNPIREEKCKFV